MIPITNLSQPLLHVVYPAQTQDGEGWLWLRLARGWELLDANTAERTLTVAVRDVVPLVAGIPQALWDPPIPLPHWDHNGDFYYAEHGATARVAPAGGLVAGAGRALGARHGARQQGVVLQ